MTAKSAPEHLPRIIEMDLGPIRIVSSYQAWVGGSRCQILKLQSDENDIEIIASKTGKSVRIVLNDIELQDPAVLSSFTREYYDTTVND